MIFMQHCVLFLYKLYLRGLLYIANRKNSFNFASTIKINTNKKMNLLFKHHFIVGWRNILKNKVQNLISILCLAVGTVLFAVTYWSVNASWNNHLAKNADNNSYKVSFMRGDTATTTGNLKKLQQFSTVKSLVYSSYEPRCYFKIKDNKGKVHSFTGTFRYVSPNWLERNHFTSAITGKKFGKLKNGTVILSYRKYDQFFTHKADSIGYEVLNFEKPRKIDDVIDIANYTDADEGLYIVNDGTNQYPLEKSRNGDTVYYSALYISNLEVLLKDGVSQKQFTKEVAQKIPNDKLSIFPQYRDNVYRLAVICTISLFLGASILIIGLTGYLKIQFQMFHIRKREMALRRCNGAKPIHLIMLLTTELFITFIFVLICAICLTVGFDEYMVPKMAFTEIGYKIDPDIFSLFKIETWVAIITLIISLLIIWISVRKVAHFPFRKSSCKSYNHKSRWKNAMQVVQFFVTTIVFFFVLIASIALILNYHNYQFVGDIDQYKQVARITSFDVNELDKLPSVKHVGRLAKLDYSYKYKGVGDSIPAMSYSPSSEIKYDSTRAACVLDPALLKLMNIKIEKNICSKVDINGKTISTLPVYVFPREAAQVSKQLGITAKPSGFVILQKRKYVKLGYAPLLDIYRMTGRLFNLYIVRPQISASTIINMANADRINYDELETLAFPKDGKYEMMCTEINKLRHQVIKQSPTHIDTNISSAYEYWFYGLAIIRFQLQFCFALVLISLVSIILTVYSSITLETRERQKEMAIRKVNGAKAHDIAKQLCRPYITNLLIAFMLTGFIGLSVVILSILHHNYHSDAMILALADYFISILTITIVTAVTIWQKVYKIARISPADIIKKE